MSRDPAMRDPSSGGGLAGGGLAAETEQDDDGPKSVPAAVGGESNIDDCCAVKGILAHDVLPLLTGHIIIS